MDFTRLTRNDDSYEQSFESLCDQLFENWCREIYANSIQGFSTINGHGGDGGVESIAILENGDTIALQAKWFPTSLSSSQINQIKNSFQTAISIRPSISVYVVALPRNLSSLKTGTKNPEDKRWEAFAKKMKAMYPKVNLKLWDNACLSKELQKPHNQDILKYWFGHSVLSKKALLESFQNSKSSWLYDRYLPQLNVKGQISRYIFLMLADEKEKEQAENKLLCFEKFSEKLKNQINETLSLDHGLKPDDIQYFQNTLEKLKKLDEPIAKTLLWSKGEAESLNPLDFQNLNASFVSESEYVSSLTRTLRLYSHYTEMKRSLDALDNLGIENIFSEMAYSLVKAPLCFVGAPWTGKTQGVASVTEELINEDFHLPLLIQAKNFESPKNWREILVSSLRLGEDWSENELWSALEALAHQQRLLVQSRGSKGSVNPKILIIVDGVDEAANTTSWECRINEVSVITSRYPSIRFCFTTRPSRLNLEKINAVKVPLPNDGDAFFPDLFVSYLKAYNIKIDHLDLAMSSIKNPMSLRLFCEIYKNKSIQINEEKDLSIGSLIAKKIDQIDDEFVSQVDPNGKKDNIVLLSLQQLATVFSSQAEIERTALKKILMGHLPLSESQTNVLLSKLESFGIIGSRQTPKRDSLDVPTFFYFSGQQGYFDFINAKLLLQKYGRPEAIRFDTLDTNWGETLHILAVLSLRDFDYLITDSPFFKASSFAYLENDLIAYALCHSTIENGQKFKENLLKTMVEGPEELREVVNTIIIPLSRKPKHPLGPQLLNEYLSSFSTPAERDKVWSIPELIDYPFRLYDSLRIQEGRYPLNPDDTAGGLPLVYAWALSSLNNSDRQEYRKQLVRWALSCPTEFFTLFKNFSSVNDPQIKNDMFSVLMCAVFDDEKRTLLKPASQWVMKNVLSPDKIEENRHLGIRYYSICILKEAIRCHFLKLTQAKTYLPPYKHQGNFIPLNEGAFAGNTSSGYLPITYDLARYVLFDHIEIPFKNYGNPYKKNLNTLLKSIGKEQPIFIGKTYVNLVISAAYQYLLQRGWNEEEFENQNGQASNETKIDFLIFRRYFPATHGSQSPVMTIAEKYVWQARYEIEGFLSDRLKGDYDNRAKWITDYSLIDDFVIPSEELALDHKHNPFWHIGEEDKLCLNQGFSSKEQFIKAVENSPSFSWEKWIQVENTDSRYPLPSKRLLLLSTYSHFESDEGFNTTLSISSVILPTKDLSNFLGQIKAQCQKNPRLFDVNSWHGSIECNCYISPKEACWFPWKKRNDNSYDDFGKIRLCSTIDACVYNFSDAKELYFDIPSKPIRKMLNIINFDGLVFSDQSRRSKAIFIDEGAENHNEQKSVLVDSEQLFSNLKKQRKSIVFVMEAYWINGSYSEEKFGEFRIRKTEFFIGYFHNQKFRYSLIKEKVEND